MTIGERGNPHPGEVASGPSGGVVALWAAAAGYAVLLIWQALTLPEQVPGHIGATGQVTWWQSLTGHVVMGTLIGVLLLACFALPARIGRRHAAMMNIPHRDYWTTEERWPTAQRMLATDLGWMGAATFAFVGYAIWSVGAVATGDDPPWSVFAVVTGIYLAGVIGYGIWMRLGPPLAPRPHGRLTDPASGVGRFRNPSQTSPKRAGIDYPSPPPGSAISRSVTDFAQASPHRVPIPLPGMGDLEIRND